MQDLLLVVAKQRVLHNAQLEAASMLINLRRTIAIPFHQKPTLCKLLSTRTPNPNSNSTQPLSESQLKSLVLSRYARGKFTNLLQNVIALPAVLLTACQNLTTPQTQNGLRLSLPDSVSKRFSIHEMGRELCENRFDVAASSVTMAAPRNGGESLVLPSLKLKVLIEAIRIVLGVVYDERFVTFSYGGRVNMGRHTAIRYLKNSVANPSWWFSVSFNGGKFEQRHVNKLCLFMHEKIEDEVLTNIIKTLFECGAVRIELGSCCFGRGFPQESGLSSILMNIYFNGFDKEIQEMRLKKNQEHPKFESNELVSEDGVFYKPVKIYAVRYLDEILVMTSGSKMLTMDLKNWVVKYLEGSLELMVDKIKTSIHSAVSEKIDFMGMELQAVPPSVLHPPMSEKAIRARKKYLRQKEVRAIELKNARERNRKKLGMKIMSHVFKKLKSSDGLKSEYQIENQVREIFRTWADEVVQEFLESLDERWDWYRKLSAGNFLSLRHIRQQLPEELVDAYDKFQEQVDKHLNPVRDRKAREEEERRVTEEAEQKYAKRTVEDLTKLCVKADAPIEVLRKMVKLIGFTNHMGRPRPITLLTALEDADIIKWYAGVGRRLLDFYCCCHNFKMVKTIVTYHLRFSCILTLAEKHESTKSEAMKHYTKDLKVFDINGNQEVYFPTEREVKMMGDKNLSDPIPVDGAFSLALIRLASDEPPYSCVAHFCDRTDTIVYRVRLLQSRLNLTPVDDKKWVPGMGAINESLHLKCFPLCPDHIHDLYMGSITFQDIDCTSFVDVD
ncbi:putative reverse transcriptase domain, domain X [Rosa chinensis]|uniref:Putative reverse transcriptase domain, domain X n=2 Tax=Rosa chinensis TaxID=74649 RepID=A0A2P6RTE0_ROSCH|nr:putative reverse transcriptase domain, domain X [Rosa chinensis]